jgi:biotin carboxylase
MSDITGYESSACDRAILIVDFNLTRREDVARMKWYAKSRYGLKAVLIRPSPSNSDVALCDHVLDADPLCSDFVEKSLLLLSDVPVILVAGLVFSDNAVHRGAELLSRLALPHDDSALAFNAFCKHAYRNSETAVRQYLWAKDIFVPNVADIASPEDLAEFVEANPGGVVVKPKAEGNNRGVILLREPVSAHKIKEAFNEVRPFLKGGVIAEQLIPFDSEYSYDGLGDAFFITEKFSATGRYPVEYAQLVPAAIDDEAKSTIAKAGVVANMLVGQKHGPFHNEVRISTDKRTAAVVEANRRPAGMHIWDLAREAFGVDLYQKWIDSAISDKPLTTTLEAGRSAMVVMLPAREPGLADAYVDAVPGLVEALKSRFSTAFPYQASSIKWLHARAVADYGKYLHVPPRDNSDFLASVAFSAGVPASELKEVLPHLLTLWEEIVGEFALTNCHDAFVMEA